MSEMNQTAKIAMNSLVQLIAGIINKFLGVALVIYAARQLGTEGFGTFSYILSVYMIFYIITDFGLGLIITRDVAQDSSKESLYFGNILIIRLGLSFIAACGLVLAVWMLGQPVPVIILSAVVSLSLFFSSNVDTCNCMFNAHQRMEIPATLNVVATTLRITTSLGALAGGAGVSALIWIHTIISFLHFMMTYKALRSFIKPIFKLNKSFCISLLKQAYPMALASLFSVVYFRVDTVMLGSMKSQSDVGLYNAAYRLLEFTLIFPAYYGGAVFPVIASSYKNNMQRFLLIYRRSMKYMWVMALPMALGVTALAPKLIGILYGQDYMGSVPVLSVLMWSLLIIAINGVSIPYLVVMEKQKIVTVFTLAMMLVNVVFNAFAIPKYGALGAAWVTFAAEFINIALYMIVLVKPLSLNIRVFRQLFRPILAGGMMYGFLLYTNNWDLGYQIMVGAIIYIGCLLLFGAFDEVDRELFMRVIRPKSQSKIKVVD